MPTWLGATRRYWNLLGVGGLLVLSAGPLAAQAAPGAATGDGSALKVALLRTTQGEATAAAEAIDGALLRDLSALAGIDQPTVSPIDYAEIQLTVGCSDEGRQCLSSIAQMVQVDAVVVRKLVVGEASARLELVYLDTTAADEPARAEQLGEGKDAADSLAAAVPTLVRRLFGIPEPVSAAAPEAARPAQGGGSSVASDGAAGPSDSGGVGPLTWVALGAGAVALGAGIAFGLSAESSFEDYKSTDIEDDASRTAADEQFDSAQSQGLAATILIPTGGVLLALGATLLILDLSGGESSGAEVAVGPLGDGALLSLRARGAGL